MEVDEVKTNKSWFGEWKPQDANYKIKKFPFNGVWKEYNALRKEWYYTSPGHELVGWKTRLGLD